MKTYLYLVERDCELGGIHSTVLGALAEIQARGLHLAPEIITKASEELTKHNETCVSIGELTSYYIYKMELNKPLLPNKD